MIAAIYAGRQIEGLGRKNTEMDRWMIVSRRQLEGLAPVTPRSNSGFRADSRPWL
jgi:hypothetical protein